MLGIEWKDLAALVSAALALGTFALGLGSLTARSRLRAKLASEVDICGKLPAGEARAGLLAVAQRDAARLVGLEDPEVLNQRRVRAGVVVAMAVLLGAGSFWTYRSDGWGGLWAIAAGVVPPALLAVGRWAERRKAEAEGRPDVATLGPYLPQ